MPLTPADRAIGHQFVIRGSGPVSPTIIIQLDRGMAVVAPALAGGAQGRDIGRPCAAIKIGIAFAIVAARTRLSNG